MNIKSYYFTKTKIVTKDYNNKTTIYDLNRDNILSILSNIDEQIDYNIDNVLEKEANAYKDLTNVLFILTLVQALLTLIVISGFINASYIVMITAITGSILVLLASILYVIIGIARIEVNVKRKKLCLGREILIKKYNSISSNIGAELIDIY